MVEKNEVISDIEQKFEGALLTIQKTADKFPTLWIAPENIIEVIAFLKNEIALPYEMLYDLTAIDEQAREHREGQPESVFTLVYTLLSFSRNEYLRLKVPTLKTEPTVDSLTSVFPVANWYEREVYDMFGIKFNGHPNLRRILMPQYWEGFPLQKQHPARATEMGEFQLPDEDKYRDWDLLQFKPEEWGMDKTTKNGDVMFLNLGPQHPGTHGVLRFIMKMDGEIIIETAPDIGFHHRGVEKMGERQSWHTFIPYTDRVEYLGGVMNNFPYVMAIEKMGDIEVPKRAQYIRIMMSELFRISSHLVWYGTFAQDLGMMTPVFLTFNDREKLFDLIQAITGARMHPNWFRIGGVSQDLPKGWKGMVKEFIGYMRKQLKLYDKLILRNEVFIRRTEGIGIYTTEEAIEWGITGPGLRATGFDWDFRKKQPYSRFEDFDFDIPVEKDGDCLARSKVRVAEIRQSLRIIEQCMNNMPSGHYKSDDSLAMPPRKDKTMKDIETLIHHFVGVSWGPVVPPGEGLMAIEGTKGNNGYYWISDGSTTSYRTRIRTPSFLAIQFVPYISIGYTVADFMAILGSVDYVLSDIDR